MTARDFDGVGDFATLGIGSLAGLPNGPCSLVGLVRRGSDGNWHCVLSIETSGGTSVCNLIINDANAINIEIGGETSGGSFTAAMGEGIVGFSKANGSATPRIHIYRQDTDTWSHVNAAGAIGNNATSVASGRVLIGRWQTTDDYDGLIGAAAAYATELSDGDFETLTGGLAAWQALNPRLLTRLNQSTTALPIRDLSGGGAHQTALAGTTAAAGFAWFDFDLTPPAAGPYVVDLRGLAQNKTSQASTAVDLPDGASIATGNYLVARVSADNAGTDGAAVTLGVTDPVGNTWTIAGPANQDPGAALAGVSTWIAYAEVETAYANGDDLTFTYSPNVTAKAIVVEEWTRVDTVTPLAVAATTATGAGTTPSISRTPTAADQLFFGALGVEGPATQSVTQDTDTTDGTWFTEFRLGNAGGTATDNVTVNGVSKLVTGTTAQAWNPTMGTSTDWAQVALVFAAASQVLTGSVNQIAETDTAQAVGEAKTRPVAQTTTTATAQVLGTAKLAAVGQPAEADAAQAISTSKIRPLGQTSETDAAGRIFVPKVVTVGQAIEAGAAQPVGKAKTKALGAVAETDESRPAGTGKARLAGQATTTDLAQSLGTAKTAAPGQTTESDTAQPVGRFKTAGLGEATEASQAQAIGSAKTGAVGQAAEIDAAQQINPAGELFGNIGQVVDASTAQPMTWAPKHRLVQQAAEADAAGLVATGKARRLGQPTDTGEAQPLVVRKTTILGRPAETDQAQAITEPGELIVPVARAVETATARPVSAGSIRLVRAATEADSAIALASTVIAVAARGDYVVYSTTGNVETRSTTGRVSARSTTSGVSVR